MRQTKKFGLYPTEAQREEIKGELAQYIDDCYQHEKLVKYDDVYVTDHTPVDQKSITNNEADDEDFYNYA